MDLTIEKVESGVMICNRRSAVVANSNCRVSWEQSSFRFSTETWRRFVDEGSVETCVCSEGAGKKSSEDGRSELGTCK